MPKVVLEHVTKMFGKVAAVSDVSMDVRDGELLVLLGPSGCGKSTVLRMIAGLESPTSGNIYIGDKLVNGLMPSERDISMVFESPNHALYPHLNVYDNMAFSLRLRKQVTEAGGYGSSAPATEPPAVPSHVSRSEQRTANEGAIRKRVEKVADRLHLQPYLERKRTELSAGHSQNVALGKALVRSGKVYLMDDPLSQLDVRARVENRTEIRKIHRETGATFVYVTHDQAEAMALGDRIAVMDNGVLQQIAANQALYRAPANMFVAQFVGSPAMNMFPVTLEQSGGELMMHSPAFDLAMPTQNAQRLVGRESIILGLRPESVVNAHSMPEAPPEWVVDAQVDLVENTGSEIYGHLTAGGVTFTARLDGLTRARPGDSVRVVFNLENMYAFDPVSSRNLL